MTMLTAFILSAIVVGAASPDACTRYATVTTMVPPDFPASALPMANGPTLTEVMVSLDASGRVTAEQVIQSSGVLALDQAALRAARESKYAPRMVDCKPVAGRYLFKVTFNK
jgi:TonB family protein